MKMEIFNQIKFDSIVFVADKDEFVPTAFLIRGEDKITDIVKFPVYSEEEKYYMIKALSDLSLHKNADRVVLVLGSFVRYVPQEEMEYVMSNLRLEIPAFYPESMRKRSLVFHSVDLKDTAKSFVHVVVYEKGKDVFDVVDERRVDNYLNPDENDLGYALSAGILVDDLKN